MCSYGTPVEQRKEKMEKTEGETVTLNSSKLVMGLTHKGAQVLAPAQYYCIGLCGIVYDIPKCSLEFYTHMLSLWKQIPL